MAISDYLNKLVELKNSLVANLNTMGVETSESEKMNTLVPKVLEINSTSGFTAYKCPVYHYSTSSDGVTATTTAPVIYIDISSIPDYDNLILGENAIVVINPLSVYIRGSSSSTSQKGTAKYDLAKDGNYITATWADYTSTNNRFSVTRTGTPGYDLQSDSRFIAMVYVFN